MIKLTKQQEEFIHNELNLSITPSEEQGIGELLSKLDRLFLEKGLKEGAEPNEYGLMIEELIDVFNREIQKIKSIRR